jgi:hypothetical protein
MPMAPVLDEAVGMFTTATVINSPVIVPVPATGVSSVAILSAAR